MKAIKSFEEFIVQGIVKKQRPDRSRVEFLIKEAEQSYVYLLELINKIGINVEKVLEVENRQRK